MPELPEVETTKNGIIPYLTGREISRLVVRQRKLRWMVEQGLEKKVKGQKVNEIVRRGKYILIQMNVGSMIIHLGMSGSMRVLLKEEAFAPPTKHDHFDIVTQAGNVIRFRDPRKFGALLFYKGNGLGHPRLRNLGVEPLEAEFRVDYLQKIAKTRHVSIKQLIMDGKVVVGVGNIYASEALFLSGIHPKRKCNNISTQKFDLLVSSIRRILEGAIQQGGTTLKDFSAVDGSPGYFEQKLSVYGREGEGCDQCGASIKRIVQTQRSTFYCSKCQY